MKKMKQIVTMVLVLILALALAVPAFAAEPSTGAAPGEKGTITINNAVAGKTYQAYRLFDLTLDKNGDRYGYTINPEWSEFFAVGGAGASYVKTDATHDNVALKDGITAAELQELAQAAKKFAEEKGITPVLPTGEAPNLTFSNLPLGYYLVTTDAGSLQALDTTNTNVVMYEKNTAPDIGKTADKTNAAINEEVKFTITVTRGGAVWGNYTVKDNMKGLQLIPGSVVVTNDRNETLVKDKDYTVTEGQYDAAAKTQSLEIVLVKSTLEKLEPNAKLTITYRAKATEVKVMENKVTMDYITKPDVTEPDGHLPEHIVKVANYEFTVQKTDEQQQPLEGATFKLYKDANCTEPAMQFVKTGDTYRLAGEAETAAEVTSAIYAGKAQIEGLAAGIYYLKEVEAPAGYNKLLNPVKVQIIENLNQNVGSNYHNQAFDDDGRRLNPTIKMNDVVVPAGSASDFVLNIVNKTGTELPSTGGIGTTVFYVVGGLMMVAAVVALITKKRMAQ